MSVEHLPNLSHQMDPRHQLLNLDNILYDDNLLLATTLGLGICGTHVFSLVGVHSSSRIR